VNEDKADGTVPRRKLGRGLSDVSHIFLSGAEPGRRLPDLKVAEEEERGIEREPSDWLPDATYISVTSGERVKGKTSLAANLAFSFRGRGYRVTIVNADPDQPDLIALTGAGIEETGGDLLRSSEPFGGLPVVTIYGGMRRAVDRGPDVVESMAAAGREARLVVADTAPLADTSYAIWKMCNLVVVITEPDIDSMRSSYVAIKRIRSAAPGVRIGLVVNRVRSYTEGEQCYRKISGVSRDFLKINLRNYGIIMRDQAAIEAGERGVPLLGAYPASQASECVEAIARLILMDESAIARRRTEVRPEECALRKGV